MNHVMALAAVNHFKTSSSNLFVIYSQDQHVFGWENKSQISKNKKKCLPQLQLDCHT